MWKKVRRWLLTPPGAARARNFRVRPSPKPADLSFRDLWLTDTAEAERARHDLYARGLEKNLVSGPWWMFSPLFTLLGVGSWLMRRRRRRSEASDRRELKRSAERYNCDGL
jgi:uncharacterized iron-regulated membrane protein